MVKSAEKRATKRGQKAEAPQAPAEVITLRPEDQSVAPAASENSAGEGKRKRKTSAKHDAWMAHPDLPLNGVITVKVEGNPKRKDTPSAMRFDLYRRDGTMTVEQYIEVFRGKKLSAKLAQKDLRWDVVHDFISVS